MSVVLLKSVTKFDAGLLKLALLQERQTFEEVLLRTLLGTIAAGQKETKRKHNLSKMGLVHKSDEKNILSLLK